MMTSSTSDNRSAPEEPKIEGRMAAAAHREVDELLKLGVIRAQEAKLLKQRLTRERVEQHDQDGMSVSDMIDMYRDLITP